MFGSGSDSGQNHTGVVGATVLMPTRFVWPYGGRRVLLSGSFTRSGPHLLSWLLIYIFSMEYFLISIIQRLSGAQLGANSSL